MRVKVYTPLFGDTQPLDEYGYLELPDGATLGDVCKRLKIPFALRKLSICRVNYAPCKSSQVLSDGDIISFIGPLSGG